MGASLLFVVTLIQFELVLPFLSPSLGAAEDGQGKEATAAGQGKGEHEYGIPWGALEEGWVSLPEY